MHPLVAAPTVNGPAAPALQVQNKIIWLLLKPDDRYILQERSSPGKTGFCRSGDEVSPGKTVCIIEAMKLFNEIESEVSGENS